MDGLDPDQRRTTLTTLRQTAPSNLQKNFDDVTIGVQMNPRIILALFLFASLLPAIVLTTESAATTTEKSEAKPWVRKLAFGILLHDIGLISDQRENGVDPGK